MHVTFTGFTYFQFHNNEIPFTASCFSITLFYDNSSSLNVTSVFWVLGLYTRFVLYEVNLMLVRWTSAFGKQSFCSPLYAAVSALSVSEVRVLKHVFIDASHQAVNVWGYLLFRLHQWQHDAQSSLSVPRLVSPKYGRKGRVKPCGSKSISPIGTWNDTENEFPNMKRYILQHFWVLSWNH